MQTLIGCRARFACGADSFYSGQAAGLALDDSKQVAHHFMESPKMKNAGCYRVETLLPYKIVLPHRLGDA